MGRPAVSVQVYPVNLLPDDHHLVNHHIDHSLDEFHLVLHDHLQQVNLLHDQFQQDF